MQIARSGRIDASLRSAVERFAAHRKPLMHRARRQPRIDITRLQQLGEFRQRLGIEARADCPVRADIGFGDPPLRIGQRRSRRVQAPDPDLAMFLERRLAPFMVARWPAPGLVGTPILPPRLGAGGFSDLAARLARLATPACRAVASRTLVTA
jgi:hypothetical protein